MRAYRITAGSTDLEGLALHDEPEHEPGPGEVAVRVRAAALNARDLSIIAGQYVGGPVARDTVPLSDGAGEVAAVGAGVSRVAVGDRVAGIFFQRWLDGAFTEDMRGAQLGGPLDGMLAERVVLNEAGLVRIPDHLSFEQAASLPCAGVTAWHALVSRGCLAPGETVLVLGTGGVSVFALQFAKAAGATVIVTSSSDDKLQRARALGADHTVNYERTSDWQAEVLKLTGGRGVDHVVEVGGATLPHAVGALATGGRIHLVGFVAGREARLFLPMLVGRLATLRSIYVGSRAMFEAMNAAIAANRIEPVVDRTFAFDRARDAYAYQKSGAHFGKVVIEV